jgi:hypothetical protein
VKSKFREWLRNFSEPFFVFALPFLRCGALALQLFSVKSRLRQFHPLRRYSLEAWYTE